MLGRSLGSVGQGILEKISKKEEEDDEDNNEAPKVE